MTGSPGASAIGRQDDTLSPRTKPGNSGGVAPIDPATLNSSHFSFSTREIPAPGKFETWRDLWMRRMVEVEVSTDLTDVFEGQIDFWAAGPLSVAGVNVRKTLYDRTASLARNGNDDFSLTLCGHDVTIRTPQGEAMQVRKRGAFFLRHDRRFSVEASDNCYTVLMRIDRKALLDLVPRGFDPDMAGFAPGSPMVDLLWSYLPVITGEANEAALQPRDMLGRHVIDLVALMLKPSRDAIDMMSGRGLKAVRTKALLDAIDRHFAAPDLSPATIARHLGISVRQVHRLLEETPKTFYEHLQERRCRKRTGIWPSRDGPDPLRTSRARPVSAT